MPIKEKNGIRYHQFELFTGSVCHAILTRQGGVSPAPWDSLNMGGTVGDAAERVRENRLRGLVTMGRNPASVFDVWQVHGVDVVCAETPRSPETPHQKADAILTDRPGITLMMRFADCVPILLEDPEHHVVGMAHAGWLGTVLGTVRHTVEAMVSRYGSKPARIRAGIGPSIGPNHYEVGEDVVTRVRAAFGETTPRLIALRDGKYYFDLWMANRILLQEAGVGEIEVSGLCTACHTDLWYSHRAEKGKTGRFGAIIALV